MSTIAGIILIIEE